MVARKAQVEQTVTPERKEAEDLHRLLAGIREQMEYMLRERFAAVEAAALDRMKERDARIAAAEALIGRLQEENREREAEQKTRLAAAEGLIETLRREGDARAEEERRRGEASLAAAESLIARLQKEAAEHRAEAERHAEKVAKMRQLAMETA